MDPSTDTISEGILERSLTITVSLLVDESTILCRVIKDISDSNPVDSEIAVLRVQGLLSCFSFT